MRQYSRPQNPTNEKDKAMTEKTKTGLMSKLFGGSSKGCCCSAEIEEIPKAEQEKAEDAELKKNEVKKNKGGCCG